MRVDQESPLLLVDRAGRALEGDIANQFDLGLGAVQRGNGAAGESFLSFRPPGVQRVLIGHVDRFDDRALRHGNAIDGTPGRTEDELELEVLADIAQWQFPHSSVAGLHPLHGSGRSPQRQVRERARVDQRSAAELRADDKVIATTQGTGRQRFDLEPGRGGTHVISQRVEKPAEQQIGVQGFHLPETTENDHQRNGTPQPPKRAEVNERSDRSVLPQRLGMFDCQASK